MRRVAARVLGGLPALPAHGACASRRSYTLTWPSKRMAAPDTSGLRCRTQARLMAWRVAKLSEQSSTTSACATAASRAAPPRRSTRASTCVSGLKRASMSRPDSALARPTLSLACRIWRCRLLSSTTSSSTRVICPTPAVAR
ncbi:Uncharacterised protein [Bordetella pertussis]|nr:Uncharacterised protein [Bordetella pertussis]